MVRMLSRVVLATAAGVAAMIAVAVATGWLAGALYLYLLSVAVEPAPAALAVGIVGLALAGLIVLAACLVAGNGPLSAKYRHGRASGSLPVDADALAAQLGTLAAQELAAAARSHPYGAFSIALAAGLAVGGCPELRDVLKAGLKGQPAQS